MVAGHYGATLYNRRAAPKSLKGLNATFVLPDFLVNIAIPKHVEPGAHDRSALHDDVEILR